MIKIEVREGKSNVDMAGNQMEIMSEFIQVVRHTYEAVLNSMEKSLKEQEEAGNEDYAESIKVDILVFKQGIKELVDEGVLFAESREEFDARMEAVAKAKKKSVKKGIISKILNEMLEEIDEEDEDFKSLEELLEEAIVPIVVSKDGIQGLDKLKDLDKEELEAIKGLADNFAQMLDKTLGDPVPELPSEAKE